MRFTHRVVAVVTSGALLGLAGLVSPALATSPTATSNWHVGVYNSSGRALSEKQASASTGNLAAFHFTTTPDTALLTTSQSKNGSAVLGDITNKTVSATFTVTGNGPFSYEGTSSGLPASARLYFQTTNAGGFNETNYWWSNPVSQTLSADGSTVTVTTTVDGANWSDFYGHFGNDAAYATGFANAAGNVTAIGLSFGGGSFFENGVGAPNATLTLNAFTVQ